MTPTQEDHEAAAADLFTAIENADHHASNADCRAAGEDLSQACPLAEAHKIRAIVLIAAALSEAVRVEREQIASMFEDGQLGGSQAGKLIAKAIRARTDAQATPAPEKIRPASEVIPALKRDIARSLGRHTRDTPAPDCNGFHSDDCPESHRGTPAPEPHEFRAFRFISDPEKRLEPNCEACGKPREAHRGTPPETGEKP